MTDTLTITAKVTLEVDIGHYAPEEPAGPFYPGYPEQIEILAIRPVPTEEQRREIEGELSCLIERQRKDAEAEDAA